MLRFNPTPEQVIDMARAAECGLVRVSICADGRTAAWSEWARHPNDENISEQLKRAGWVERNEVELYHAPTNPSARLHAYAGSWNPLGAVSYMVARRDEEHHLHAWYSNRLYMGLKRLCVPAPFKQTGKLDGIMLDLTERETAAAVQQWSELRGSAFEDEVGVRHLVWWSAYTFIHHHHDSILWERLRWLPRLENYVAVPRGSASTCGAEWSVGSRTQHRGFDLMRKWWACDPKIWSK